MDITAVLGGEFRNYLSALAAGSIRWHYVLTTLAVMFGIYLLSRRNSGSGVGLRAAFSFLFPKDIYLNKSAVTGYKSFLIDPIIRRIFFSPAMQLPVIYYVFSYTQKLLLSWLGEPSYQFEFHYRHPVVFAIAFTVISALLRDLGYYWQHILMHKIPFLWEFHKTHHSATVLTPLTDWRLHPLDLLSIPYFQGFLLGGMQAVLDYALTSELSPVTLMGVNAVIFVYYSVGYHLRHTHLWLSFGWHLNHIFMSPAQHQIHHSTDVRHRDKNLSSSFALWDWVFGTLYVPKQREELVFGLSEEEDKEYQGLWDLYALPFKKNARAGRTPLVALLIAVLAFFMFKAISIPRALVETWSG